MNKAEVKKLNSCEGLFYWSFIISLFLLIATYILREPVPFHLPISHQWLIQSISFILLLVLLFSCTKISWKSKIKIFIFLSIGLAILALAEDYFGAIAFGYSLPQDASPDFLSKFMEQIGLQNSNGACPSGYAMRQTIITLSALFILYQPHLIKTNLINKYRGVIIAVFLAFFFYIFLGRIAGHHHQLIDLAVGISLSTIIFWSSVYIFIGTKILGGKIEKYPSLVALFAGGFFMLFVGISKVSLYWVWLLPAILSLVIGSRMFKVKGLKIGQSMSKSRAGSIINIRDPRHIIAIISLFIITFLITGISAIFSKDFMIISIGIVFLVMIIELVYILLNVIRIGWK